MKAGKVTGMFAAVIALMFACQTSLAQGGYALMRVFDCNKSIGMGSGYLAAKIIIVYDDISTEEIDLLPYNEKNEIENMKTVNKALNMMKSKGYFLISQSTSGEQGTLVTDYSFLKQPH